MKNIKRTYKIRSYINAGHAIRWDEGVGQQHNHTWEITCEIFTENDSMIIFNDLEETLERVFSIYSGNVFNNIPPFDEINPTLENIAEYFFDEISKELAEIKAGLEKIEVGESPTRLYCIGRGD